MNWYKYPDPNWSNRRWIPFLTRSCIFIGFPTCYESNIYHIFNFRTLTRTGSFHGCSASLYGKVYGYHYISYRLYVPVSKYSWDFYNLMIYEMTCHGTMIESLWNSNFRSKCMTDIKLMAIVVKRKIILNKLNINSR